MAVRTRLRRACSYAWPLQAVLGRWSAGVSFGRRLLAQTFVPSLLAVARCDGQAA